MTMQDGNAIPKLLLVILIVGGGHTAHCALKSVCRAPRMAVKN